MSFIRPGATATMLRWRETLIGTVLVLLGLWWAFGFIGLIPYLGYLLILLGGLLIVVGLQRARFRIPGEGPGILRITEDQITYFGPLTGGAAALSDLTELSIDTSGKPAHWVLSQPMQPDLYIPVTANGAEALFDVFSRLPGLKTEFMLSRMQAIAPGPTTIWRATQTRKELT